MNEKTGLGLPLEVFIKAAEADLRKVMMVVGLTGLTLSGSRNKDNMHRKDIDYAIGVVDIMVKLTGELQGVVDNLERGFKEAQLLLGDGGKDIN